MTGRNGFVLWMTLLSIHAIVAAIAEVTDNVQWETVLALYRLVLMVAMVVHLGWLIWLRHFAKS